MQGRTLIAPHADDVASFTRLNTSTSGLLDDTTQMAVLVFQAGRFFWSNQMNSNFPVYAVAFMSLTVFWLPEEELASRIEICVALFLTLIAIQVRALWQVLTRAGLSPWHGSARTVNLSLSVLFFCLPHLCSLS